MGRHDVVYAYSGTLLINKRNKLLTHASTYEPEKYYSRGKGWGEEQTGIWGLVCTCYYMQNS